MKLEQLFEGMMKRSDPYISGERSVPTVPKQKPEVTKRQFDTKILNLAAKAKVSPEKVEQIWLENKKKLDMTLPNAYAILMNRVKKELNIL